MSDTAQIIAAALTAAIPGILGLIAALIQLRRSRAAGVQQKHAQEQEHDLARDVHELAVLREGVAFLREEVGRLRTARTEDREEISQLQTDLAADRKAHAADMREMRANHDAVVQENRRFRDVILAVMEQLRRIPPPEHSDILAYILRHLPGLGKDLS